MERATRMNIHPTCRSSVSNSRESVRKWLEVRGAGRRGGAQTGGVRVADAQQAGRTALYFTGRLPVPLRLVGTAQPRSKSKCGLLRRAMSVKGPNWLAPAWRRWCSERSLRAGYAAFRLMPRGYVGGARSVYFYGHWVSARGIIKGFPGRRACDRSDDNAWVSPCFSSHEPGPAPSSPYLHGGRSEWFGSPHGPTKVQLQ